MISRRLRRRAALGVAWFAGSLICFSFAADKTDLRLLCEIEGRELPFAGLDEDRMLVRDGNQNVPAPSNALWKVEGDLLSNKTFIEWFPRHTVTRPSELEVLALPEKYETVTINWEGLGKDVMGNPREKENPFTKDSKSGQVGPGVALALWLIDGKAAKVLPYPLPLTTGGINLEHDFSFTLSRQEAIGQPILMFWREGSFVAAAPAFKQPATQRAFLATVLDDVTGLEGALVAGAKLNATTPSGLNLAHVAAGVGAEHTLACLIKHQPALAKMPPDGGPGPIKSAVLAGRTNCVKLLVASNADPFASGQSNSLCDATLNGHAEVVRELTKADPRHEYSVNALQNAIEGGHAEIAEFLTSSGTPYDFSRPGSRWALVKAARGGNLAMLNFLLARGVSANAEQFAMQDWESGVTALMEAAQGRSLAAATLLLDHGADAKKKTSLGSTALQIAARENASEITDLLLAHGADMTARNVENHSALDLALLNCSPGSARVLGRKGARIDLKATDTSTLLEYALRLDCPEIINGAMADGWSPNSQIHDNWSALAAAHEFSATLCEQLLRDAGATLPENPTLTITKATDLDAPVKPVKLVPPEDPRPKFERTPQTIKVQMIIDHDGRPLCAQVLESHERELIAATLKAVPSWQFVPPSKNGRAVTTRVVVPVSFKGATRNVEAVGFRFPVLLDQSLPHFPPFPSASGVARSYLIPAGRDGVVVYEDKPSDAGLVILGFDVDPQGRVANIRVQESQEPAFSAAASTCLRQWRFIPGVANGRAVSMAMTVHFRFAPPYFVSSGAPQPDFSRKQ